ncbi:MAG: hypothetical protein ACYDGM_10610 [Vulcanimicrobiaceae bacterium]
MSSSLFKRAVVAGIIGGVLIDVFLITVGHQKIPGLWQFVASTLIGPVAFTSTSYALLGLLMHFAVSIVWAVLYAYVYQAMHQLSNWILGTIAWGIIVDVVMQAVLAARGVAPFTLHGVIAMLVPHVIFFALPVAYYLSRTPKRARH